MKKSSSGSSRVAAPRCSASVAPSAISAGGVSPIGEPLAILPPIVPDVADLLAGEAAHQFAEVADRCAARCGIASA